VSIGRARPTFHEFHDRVPNSEDTNTTQLGYQAMVWAGLGNVWY